MEKEECSKEEEEWPSKPSGRYARKDKKGRIHHYPIQSPSGASILQTNATGGSSLHTIYPIATETMVGNWVAHNLKVDITIIMKFGNSRFPSKVSCYAYSGESTITKLTGLYMISVKSYHQWCHQT